jgi:hypothetical protein
VSGKKISFDTVREMGLALPDVEEGTTYGSPALKVRGKMFACLAIHRSAEPDSLAIRIDFDQREELMAADPATYYLTDHFAICKCLVNANQISARRIKMIMLPMLIRQGGASPCRFIAVEE